jgi:hypothetical protein
MAEPEPELGERHREETVECSGLTFHALVPVAWARDDAMGGECGSRWTVTPPEGGRAWVIVHCLPAQRLGLPELDAWYGLFRQPDGLPMPEIGVGRASIGSTCGLREVGIDPQGTLVSPIPCAPITLPATDITLHRRVLESPRANFVFDLVGPSAMLEQERSGVWADGRWFASIAADFAAFVSSMRETPAPTSVSPYARPCP